MGIAKYGGIKLMRKLVETTFIQTLSSLRVYFLILILAFYYGCKGSDTASIAGAGGGAGGFVSGSSSSGALVPVQEGVVRSIEEITVSSIKLVDDKFKIEGTNLNLVESVRMSGSSFEGTFVIEERSETELILSWSSSVQIKLGTLMEIIPSRNGEDKTIPIVIKLPDASLEVEMLGQMGSQEGQLLRYIKAESKWKPGSLTGFNYQGEWDASANDPDLSKITARKGDYYVVSEDGTTELSGISSWVEKNRVVFDGSKWTKLETTPAVQDIFGRKGNVVSMKGDYSWKQLNLSNSTIQDFANVDVSAIQPGHVLRWDGSGWVASKDNNTAMDQAVIEESNIATDSVTSEKIAPSSITNTHISDNAAIEFKKLKFAASNLTIAKTQDLQSQLDGKIELSGGILSGTLNMGGNNIINLGSINGADLATLKASLDSKENFIPDSFDSSYFYNGKREMVPLTTSRVVEKDNLFFTEARVLAVPLVGYAKPTTAPYTLSSTVKVIDAFSKLENQIDGLSQSQSSTLLPNTGGGITGVISSTGNIQSGGGIKLKSGGNSILLKAPSPIGQSYSLTLPAANGSTGQVLFNVDGNGKLGFKTHTNEISSANIPDGILSNASVKNATQISWSKIDKTGAKASDVGALVSTRKINTGTGLKGGGDLSNDLTLSVDVGSGPNQIVKLEGSGATGILPALDGSNLINIKGGTGDMEGVITSDGLKGGGDSGVISNLAVDRGTAANKILVLDGNGYMPSIDGPNLKGISLPSGRVEAVLTPGAGLSGGQDSGDIGLNLNVGNGPDQIIKLDNDGKIPAVDGSNITNIPFGDGDISSVLVGDGLSGGGSQLDVTLSLDLTKVQAKNDNLDALSALANPSANSILGTADGTFAFISSEDIKTKLGIGTLSGNNFSACEAGKSMSANGSVITCQLPSSLGSDDEGISITDSNKIVVTTSGAKRIVVGNRGKVAMGAALPNTSAQLEVKSNSKGFLPPRMSGDQRDAITSPATGLLVYNTDDNEYNFYNGTEWTSLKNSVSKLTPLSIKKVSVSGQVFVPDETRTVKIMCVGAGGGASGVDEESGESGAGGGAGGYAEINLKSEKIGEENTLFIDLGRGGEAGASGPDADDGSGGGATKVYIGNSSGALILEGKGGFGAAAKYQRSGKGGGYAINSEYGIGQGSFGARGRKGFDVPDGENSYSHYAKTGGGAGGASHKFARGAGGSGGNYYKSGENVTTKDSTDGKDGYCEMWFY